MPPLLEGDLVSIQDQTRNTPRRWSKTGIVLEDIGNDSYQIKVDGSNRVTRRNRQFLRKIIPYAADIIPTEVHNPGTPSPRVTDIDEPSINVTPKDIGTTSDHVDSHFIPTSSSPQEIATPPSSTSQAQPHTSDTTNNASRPLLHSFKPPLPGIPHIELLRRLEVESRQMAEASKKLAAYLASILTSQAAPSLWEGGIYSDESTEPSLDRESSG